MRLPLILSWKTQVAIVPVIVVYGAFEFADRHATRQVLVHAAQEAAQYASRRDGTRVQAERLATEVLSAGKIDSSKIQFLTGDPQDTPSGSDVTVRVSVQYDGRGRGLPIFRRRINEAVATIPKE
jgi:Flp pilus assembly protein TadG